jgi:hypothetical protein
MKEMAIENISANYLCMEVTLVVSVAVLNRPLVGIASGVPAVGTPELFVLWK